mgnify:CR=1 FL=1
MKCYTSVATATEEWLTERPWAVVTSSLPGIPLDRFARAAVSVLGCHEGDEGYEYGHRQHAGGRLPGLPHRSPHPGKGRSVQVRYLQGKGLNADGAKRQGNPG